MIGLIVESADGGVRWNDRPAIGCLYGTVGGGLAASEAPGLLYDPECDAGEVS